MPAEPPHEYLIDQKTFGEALKKVGVIRLNQTIYAEYPDHMPHIKALGDYKKGRRGQYFLSDLKRIWHMDDAQALQTVDGLVRIGVFNDKKTSNSGLKIYRLPKIYKFALNMVEESVFLAEA